MSVRPLTEYCTLNMGQSPDSKTYNTQGNGLPFYQGNADFGETHPITRVWCSAPVKVAEEGDILISVRAPIGAMNMAVERCCIGRGLAALTPIRNKCSKQFLYYALQSKVDSLIAQGTGSTFKAISKKVLEATCIPAYSTIEQEQIAETIGHVDNTIAAKRKQLALLDQLVKSRFIELFASVEAEDTLQNLCTFIDYRGKTPEKVESGLPFITAKNIRMHRMSFDTLEYISKETYDRVMTRGFPQIGDVVFTTEAPLGNVCRIPFIETEFYIGQRIITMQTERLEPAYLEYALSSDEFKRKIAEKSSGSTVTGIRSKLLEQLTIPVPPRSLQERFAAFVEQTDKSKYYSSLSFRYCQAAANTYRQEWMTCRTSDF